MLTDDRLSRASDHTNSFSSTLSLAVTPVFIYTQLDWLSCRMEEDEDYTTMYQEEGLNLHVFQQFYLV